MEVVVYTTGCPMCRVIETKLDQKGIEFSKVEDIQDIEAKGFLSVPQLEVNGKIFAFTDANKLLNEYDSEENFADYVARVTEE